MKKRIVFMLFVTLIIMISFVLTVSAENSYGTDEEKLLKQVTITLNDGTEKSVPLYDMVSDSTHSDYGKVLALTWYYDESGNLTYGYTHELITVNSNGAVTYNNITASSVIVANFQCDNDNHATIKSFNFTYYTKDASTNSNNTTIQYVYMPDTLVSLATNMFRACTSLKVCDFTVNSSLTTYGMFVFDKATSLKSIYIPKGVKTLTDSNGSGYGIFYGCTSLESVMFAEDSQLTKLGDLTFTNCTSLKEVILPEGLLTIGFDCFRNCTNLERVDVPDSVTTIEYGCFRDSGIIYSPFSTTSGVTSIEKWAFYGAARLTEINIPAGITILPAAENIGVFRRCYSLVNVHFNENSQLTTIEEYAFAECSALVSITLPNSVTTIQSRLFAWCSSLVTANLGSGLTTYNMTETDHSSLFFEANSIKYIYLPATFLNIDSNVCHTFPSGSCVTFFITGTYEEALAIQDIFKGVVNEDNKCTSNNRITEAILYQYDSTVDYTTFATNKKQHVIIYDYNKCTAFYNDIHTGKESLVYSDGFAASGTHSVECTRCNSTVSETVAPIIVALGYSSGEFNLERTMMTSGFTVDVELVSLYEKLNNVELEIGILFAVPSQLTSVPTSFDGLKYISDKEEGKTYATYNYIISFPKDNETYSSFEFVVSAFIKVSDKYTFYQTDDCAVNTLESGFKTTTLNKVLAKGVSQ